MSGNTLFTYQNNGIYREQISSHGNLIHYGIYGIKAEPQDYLNIPPHWHSEFEIGYVKEGRVIYRSGEKEYCIRSGDAIFINSGVIHSAHNDRNERGVVIQSQFFDSTFIAGGQENKIDSRYISPVRENMEFDIYPIYRDNPNNERFLELFREAVSLCEEKDRFYELRLRSVLSYMWENISNWSEQSIENLGLDNSNLDPKLQ